MSKKKEKNITLKSIVLLFLSFFKKVLSFICLLFFLIFIVYGSIPSMPGKEEFSKLISLEKIGLSYNLMLLAFPVTLILMIFLLERVIVFFDDTVFSLNYKNKKVGKKTAKWRSKPKIKF